MNIPKPKHRNQVPPDSFDPIYRRATYRGRHVARRRDCAPDWINTAQCRSEVRGRIEGISGTLAGRLLRNCHNEVCAHHHPEEYASHLAKHAPESFSDSVLAGRMMSDW